MKYAIAIVALCLGLAATDTAEAVIGVRGAARRGFRQGVRQAAFVQGFNAAVVQPVVVHRAAVVVPRAVVVRRPVVVAPYVQSYVVPSAVFVPQQSVIIQQNSCSAFFSY